MSGMPGQQNKRNQDVPPPNSKITGSSGSTDQGSLITVSGGARVLGDTDHASENR